MVCLTKFSRKSLFSGVVEKVSVYRFYDTNSFHVCQYRGVFDNGFFNIMPDDEGHANAYITVKKVRPYLGIGFGRAVPSASRLNCQIDLGVQLSGKPHVYNGVSHEELTAEGANGEDGGHLKTISRMKCYPVLSIRLSGRLF